MKVAIMQPTWLPWLGYFDLIDQADRFVFLDTVQFEKQTWQQRNRLKSSGGLGWITVPVFIKGQFGQSIADVQIDRRKFPSKHLRTIRQNYSRAVYFNEYIDEFSDLLEEGDWHSLCELNIAVIDWLCEKFGIETELLRASQMKANGKRSERLVSILNEFGSNDYLSPMGSLEYLQEDRELFEKSRVSISFQNYVHPEYQQLYPPFLAGASALDLLFNEGLNSLQIIRSGRDLPIPAAELMD